MKKGIVFLFVLLLTYGFIFAEEKTVTLFTIGDSTVKNGDGSGRNQQWGWGDFIEAYFNTDQVRIENHAMGGRSSRTFQEEGRWQKVLDHLKPGDYVMIQFGHNDGGSFNKDRARGTIKGSGEETETVIMEATGKENTIHTYGWYIRKYVRETKEKGATPIVISHIPRNIWKNGAVERNNQSYGKWCKEVCEQENALFIDLNELVSRQYETMGESTVRAYYFEGDHTHTSLTGAKLNARIVAGAVKEMKIPLAGYLKQPQPNRKLNFNPEWKLYFGDGSGWENPGFDDSSWKQVTLPHAFNEDDAFCKDIKDLTTGIVWYRKSFKLPAAMKGKKVFVEFEGIRQAGEFFINGKSLGMHENGIMAVGFDLTPYLNLTKENVLAVRIDNSWDYKEKATGSEFQWNNKNFNANYGGIPKNVWLHVTDKIYQTLPLYSNLGTTGVYVYADNISVRSKTADVHVEAEVKNEYAKTKKVSLEVSVFDLNGRKVSSFQSTEESVSPGAKKIITASSPLSDLYFWSWGFGYLYTVESSLRVDGKITDMVSTVTGFRKTRFADGMFWLNDRVLQLKGYAQRTSNEWPAVGMSVSPWLSDYSNRLIVESNGNLVRWMHTCPWKQDVESCDRVGLIQAMPAGDAEKDVEGRQWEQRKDVMRDAIIYNRNNPSIIFYECGNESISEEHMAEMKVIRDMYDPNGGRAIGSREMLDSKIAEYGGEMLYINKSAKHPMWATEYMRDEALRKYWDSYSYPYHPDGEGPLYRNADASVYNRNQDSQAVENIIRWFDYWRERPGTGKRVSSGGAKIIFSDTNTHHRGAENYRRSGVTDAMRIPKDGFYVHQVIWDGWVDIERPRTHIIGHWNYNDTTVKPVYVVSSGSEQVELFVNGESKGFGKKSYEFLYTFDSVAWKPGTIKAVSYSANNRVISSDSILTAGEPEAIRMKLITGPAGLIANGADLALVEIEVVDAGGRRCPLANDMIHYDLTGNAEWRGGIAQGENNYILAKSFPVECGVNRALIRSTTQAGTIVLKATADGLKPATVEFASQNFVAQNGYSATLPSQYTLPYLNRWETPKTPSYTVSRIPVEIESVKGAGSNFSDVINSYDDNELSEWKNDGKLSTAWITYRLKRDAELNEIVVKLTGWRMRSYPIEILVDNKLVYSGETPKSLGYVTLPLKPVRGREITVRLTGSASEQEAFGQVVELSEEGKSPVRDLDLYKDPNAENVNGQLRIVEIEFYECLN